MRILVIYGGESGERDVSCATARACARQLGELGHEVLTLDGARPDELRALADTDFGSALNAQAPEPRELGGDEVLRLGRTLLDCGPELVYNCLHGGFGEDGRLAALCSLLGLPISSSPYTAAGIAMDKDFSKRLMVLLGIPTAAWRFLDQEPSPGELDGVVAGLGLPLVVKPNTLGSSVGISLVRHEQELAPAVALVRSLGDRPLLEAYVPGRELTCGWLAGRILPLVEIRAGEGWYDYQHKYSGGTEYHCPVNDLAGGLEHTIAGHTERLNRELGCAGITRTDWRLDPQGRVFCLEVNTVPGMTATSLVPKAAKAAGLDFGQLLAAHLAGLGRA
jgi:D-alanine-D-alanine ligase